METSVAVLVDAKREYTNQLIQAIRPFLLSGVLSIYDEAFNVCQQNKETDLTMLTFQELLGEIPKWNHKLIMEESDRIVTDSKCDYLEDLLTAVFVCHTKILTTVRVTNKDRKVDLKIPCVENFVHQVYIEMAREFWKHPYLLNPLDVSKLEYQQNLKEAENIIHQCMESTIRRLLPVKDILKEYIVQGTTEDDEVSSDEFMPSNMSPSQIGGSTSATADTPISPTTNKEPTSHASKSTASPPLLTKSTLQKQLTALTKDAELTVKKDNTVTTPHKQPLCLLGGGGGGGGGGPTRDSFNQALAQIEGSPSPPILPTTTTDIKTVTTDKTSPLGSIGSLMGGASVSKPLTVNTTPAKPVLSSPVTTLSLDRLTSSKPASPVTALSLDHLTGGGSSLPKSPVSPTKSTSEISLDSLGSIEEVTVDFGAPSSSVKNEVKTHLDTMTATPALTPAPATPALTPAPPALTPAPAPPAFQFF